MSLCETICLVSSAHINLAIGRAFCLDSVIGNQMHHTDRPSIIPMGLEMGLLVKYPERGAKDPARSLQSTPTFYRVTLVPLVSVGSSFPTPDCWNSDPCTTDRPGAEKP